MKNFKRLICTLLMVCMLIPLGSMMISASTPDISWRKNTSNIMYFDGYDATTEATNPGLDKSYATSSGTSLIGRNNAVYAKYDDKDYYLRVNYYTDRGWLLLFDKPTEFDDTTKDKYFSIRYMVVDETKSSGDTGTFYSSNYEYGDKNKLVQFTGELVHNTWKTVTVNLMDNSAWTDGSRDDNIFNSVAGICVGLYLPALADGGYYVIDYIGTFGSQSEAEYISAMHDEFAADGTVTPYAPQMSVAGGTYNSVQTVSIEKFNDNATVYYTTDGTEPTKTSTEYTAPITVDKTQTIKAIAYIGEKASKVTSVTYTIDLKLCANPTFSLTGSVIPDNTPVEIKTTTEGAEIYYTTDGTTPSKDSGTKYTAPVTVSKGMTLKAIAVKAEFTDSDVVSQTFSATLPKDIFWSFGGMTGGSRDGQNTLAQGVYNNDTFPKMTVVSAAGSQGANIINAYSTETGGFVVPHVNASDYTIIRIYPADNSNANTATIPNVNWKYVTVTYKSDKAVDFSFVPHVFQQDSWSTPVELAASETYKTVVIDIEDVLSAWGEGQGHFGIRLATDDKSAANLELLSISFHVDETSAQKETVSIPVASVEAGSYTTEISVELTSATSGASIYYTTDGSEPSKSNGTLYNGAIVLSKDTTLKAIALKDNCYDSVVATFEYKITPTVFSPVVNLDAGKYEGTQKIEITCETEGAKIYYTLDGTNPSATNGTLYEGAFEISENCILKVIAIKDGLKDSKVVGRNYQITAVEGSSDNEDSSGADAADTSAAETEATEEKKGCKSSITMASVVMISALSGAGVVVCRKKKD